MKKTINRILIIAVLFFASVSPAISEDITGEKGEFKNHCAMSLALGTVVDTDCAINWKDAETSKTYCFSSGRMREAWLNGPKEKIEQARQSLAGRDVNEVNVYRGDSEHDH